MTGVSPQQAYRATRCKAKCQGDWHPYACANARSTTINYQGRNAPVCGTHAKQYRKWVAEDGQTTAEQRARSSWNWRDLDAPPKAAS